MKIQLLVSAVCLLLIGGFVAVRADDKPADTKKTETTASKAKLTKPWSEMTDLSDDQKAKIKEVHGKANEDIKAIHEKESADIMALLNDDQKTEAKKLMEPASKKKADETKKDDSKKDTAKIDAPAK